MRFPTTKTSLLKAMPSDEAAWTEFFNRYREVVADLGKFKGLTDCECDDLVQNVMLRFDRKLSGGFVFDPSLARFRTYFATLIKGCIYDLLRQRKHSGVPLENIPEAYDENTPDELLDMIILEKYRAILWNEALTELTQRVDDKTYQAFSLFCLKKRPISEVSQLLRIPPGNVYTAKSRCVKILAEIIKRLNQADPELKLEQR